MTQKGTGREILSTPRAEEMKAGHQGGCSLRFHFCKIRGLKFVLLLTTIGGADSTPFFLRHKNLVRLSQA